MSSNALETIERAFDIIDILWDRNGATPSEVAEDLDMPRSTVHGYLKTMESSGYLVSNSGTYRLGYKFLSLGGRIKHRTRLFHIARPELERLARETGEIADISVEERGKTVTVHHERGDQSLSLGLYPGMTIPVHSHATGKVILANKPEAYTDAILADGLDFITEQTITDPSKLREELAKIRDQGYAYDWDEQVRGMGVVAAPILVDGSVLGSVALVCPTGRVQDEEYRTTLIQKVIEASDTIEINFQYSK